MCNCKDTIILRNPPKLNGKSCVKIVLHFFNPFFNADTVPADLKVGHFSGKIDASGKIVKFL